MPVYTRGMLEKGVNVDAEDQALETPRSEDQRQPIVNTGDDEFEARSNHRSSAASTQSSWATTRKTTSSRVSVIQSEVEKAREWERLEEEKDRIRIKSIERKQMLVEQEAQLRRSVLEDGQGSNISSSSRKMQDVDEEMEVQQHQKMGRKANSTANWVNHALRSKTVPEPVSMLDHHATEEGANAPKMHCQPFVNQPTFPPNSNSSNPFLQPSFHQPEEGNEMKKFLARQTGGKDLPFFSGEPADWPSFFSIFKKSTEVCGFSDEENLMRLVKVLKGKAKESVQSMLDASCRIQDIINILKMRFGRPQAIMKSMIEKAKSVPAPSEKNFEALIDFSVTVKNLCATAENLELPHYVNNPSLMDELVRKLPQHLQLNWGVCVNSLGHHATLLDFSTYLDAVSAAAIVVCDIESSDDPKKKTNSEESSLIVDTRQQPTSSHKSCFLECQKPHKLQHCPKFKAMTVEDRFNVVKKNRICFSCLNPGHSWSRCNMKAVCGVNGCAKNHNRLLHTEKRKEREDVPATGPVPIEDKSSYRTSLHRGQVFGNGNGQISGVISAAKSTVDSGMVIMRVVPVTLHGPKGIVKANAFLDEGSSVTMLDADVASSLGLQGEEAPLSLSWLNSCSRSMDSKLVDLKIQGLEKNAEEFRLKNVRTVKNLNLPVQPLNSYKLWKRWKHLEGVPYPDILDKKPVILIGQDNIDLTMPRKIVEGPRNSPVATFTKLGWVVHGRNYMKQCEDAGVSFVAIENQDDLLHETVKENFRLDALGVISEKSLPKSKDDIRADAMMEDMSRRVEDGWETGMLWKTDDITLPPSKHAAMRRLKLLEKQMDEDPEFSDLYCAKIDEYIEKGFCQKLSPSDLENETGREWYLPHFGTRNPNKPAKLRLVFDCAAKCNGTSLNDALIQGPDLMCSLISVLAKFRQREIAFSGDIRDMFHMVKIRQEDLPALRFLWRGKDRCQPPEVWTMNVMVFGAVSSPYQAQWIKNKNAEEFKAENPEAVEAIQKRHYVDDYLDSTRTVEDAIFKIMQVRDAHKKGGFEIRNWLCSSEDVLKVVSPYKDSGLASLELQADEKLERVLGLHWDPKADVFKFKTTFRTVDHALCDGGVIPTKRQILKLVMCLFDPLGFLGHFTVRAKILIQDIWRLGLGWDDEIVESLHGKWRSIIEQISRIPEVKIPRCYGPNISDAEDLQLHVFCDASEQAFCAVAYFRITGRGGDISVNIVVAKSRVSPLRPTSIPRLELQAALVGSRLAAFVRENHDLEINSTFLWTDSRNVLCWLRAEDPRRFKPYVAHRIGEIQEQTDASMWRWVPTAMNPADDGTRDTTQADMSSGARWICGPEFLKMPIEDWPTEKKEEDLQPTGDLEMKTQFVGIIQQHETPLRVEDYSNWLRLIRVTAWMFRFKLNLGADQKNTGPAKTGPLQKNTGPVKTGPLQKNTGPVKTGPVQKKTGPLLVKEIRFSENFWIKKCQAESFEEELYLLQNGKPIEKKSKIFHLSPVLKNGIIVVGTRLIKSPNLTEEAKFPPVLEAKHPWTKLLVESYHRDLGHHGLELISNELRQRYWIVGLRLAVKDASKKCLKCREDRAKAVPPQMAVLPDFRVTRPPRPFTYVGVDYFGPIEVNILRRKVKRWGVLFTCLSTRAIHLEVAYSLSTDGMLMALERFVCRRGEPVEIWSDNGTNFKGADHEMKKCLQEMDQEKIQDKLSCRRIVWNFIPPGAPHMGGAWERLVRSVKQAMSTILKNQSLTDELLQTVLAEAEVTVNSRPLTCVSIDKDDEEAITPNCFLIGSTSVKQPPGNFSDSDLSLRKKWRIAQVLADHFWRRWIKEYLPSLSLRTKWRKQVPDVKIGDIVFIADSNELRNQWIKGVVDAVYPGEDGQVRVADVRTAGGKLRRPVVKLLRIETD
ncbi:unnamed protein product [Orchesella dallaii]|uniref:Integrase catalytic domain-containing protein n=1 Tax=Orchesella dallaii TaxID=48710 RepID=A0ABP1QSR9_9HEXA